MSSEIFLQRSGIKANNIYNKNMYMKLAVSFQLDGLIYSLFSILKNSNGSFIPQAGIKAGTDRLRAAGDRSDRRGETFEGALGNSHSKWTYYQWMNRIHSVYTGY